MIYDKVAYINKWAITQSGDIEINLKESIYSFLERKQNSNFGIKISRANYGFHNNIQSIPFYGIMKFCTQIQ